MRLFNRRSQPQRLLDTVTDLLDAPSGIRFGVPRGGDPGKALKAALTKDKAVKAGVIAGGLAGVTAGSAGISALRRHKEGARGDS